MAEPAPLGDSNGLKKAKLDGGLPTIVESEVKTGQTDDDGPANESTSGERPQRNRRQPERFRYRLCLLFSYLILLMCWTNWN